MNDRPTRAILAAVLLVLAGAAHAEYAVVMSVIGSGAGRPASGSHDLVGTVGQVTIGPTSGPTYWVHGGFWSTEEQIASDLFDLVAPQPIEYGLDQNHPNPFNPTTRISFALADVGRVKLLLFDIEGRRVKTLVDQEMTGGLHSVTLDAQGLASGVYFYSLQAGRYRKVRKLTLLD